jgi:effector-binding domain-containing protein
MLTLRRAQVAEQIATDQVRLAEIERRLRSIEGGSMSELEFVEKPLPAVRVAQLVDSVADQPEIRPIIGPMFQRLAAALSGSGIALDQPAIAWYRPSDDRMQIAAAFPIALTEVTADLADAGVQVATLDAAANAVAVLHCGGMETIGDTWQALARHIEDKGYRSAGIAREVYLHMPMDADSAGWVTELQQPVSCTPDQ